MNSNNLRRMDRLSWFLSSHRVAVLVCTFIMIGVFLCGAFNIRGEIILRDLFPYDHPYLKLHDRFSEVFGTGGSGVVIAIKAKEGDIFNKHCLAKIREMTAEVELWDEVYRSLTVSIASHSVKVVKALKRGEIAIQPLMWPEIPSNSQDMELLKKNIFSNPAYKGVLVSGDGSAALLLTEFRENISYAKAFEMLRKLTHKYSDEEFSIHIVGFPMLMGWIYSFRMQTLTAFAISAVLMILILYWMFRSALGMIAPMANALILTILGLGFIGFTGINFSPLLYVLAFLMGARMISNSVQITYRYFEELHASGGDRARASYQTMRTMFFPNWTGVATDCAGFAVLGLAKIVLMQHLAIIMTFWMLSIGLTNIMVPNICSLIPLKVASERWAKENCQVDWLAQAIMRLTRFCISSYGRYVLSALIIGLMIFCGWQMSRLKIGDPTPGSPLLWPSHTYNQDQMIINKLFDASSENFILYYEGERKSVFDPIVFTTFEAFDRHMKERLPDIYKSSSSYVSIIKMVNLTFHDGDEIWNQLPRNDTLLTGIVGYTRSNTDRGTIARFMDTTYERAQTTLYFWDHTSDNLLRIRDTAYDFFKNHSMKIEKGEFKLAGGRIGLEIALNEEMKRAHLIIDATVLAAIFLLCTLSFMSITAGLMLTLPLIFANSVAFAYMSLTNIGLSINTLPIAAIGVGVGVDFAIYLYSRCMEEFPIQEKDWSNTIIQSVCTTGKAVVYTGLTIILPVLVWYFVSDIKFQAEVGFFLAMIMGINVILALTLHPLLIYIIKPKFMRRSKVSAVEGGVNEPKGSLGPQSL